MHSSDSSMSVMPSLCRNWIIYPVKCIFVNAKVIVTHESYWEFGEGPAKILVSVIFLPRIYCAVYEDCFIEHLQRLTDKHKDAHTHTHTSYL